MTTAHPRPGPFRLNDGHRLPTTGLGTFAMTGPDGVESILSGLRAGYRLLDTATGYRNESEVGTALARAPMPRNRLKVVSKLRGPDHAYERARQSVRDSRRRLGGHPVDLYLIHWPNPRRGLFVEAWRALVDARAAGDVISIGVSNFQPEHLAAVIEATGVTPAVNQVELHPYFPQPDLGAVHAALGVCTQSWSPLGLGGPLLAEPAVRGIAAAHGVTSAQVVLRWNRQLGCLPVVRSTRPRRQAENLDTDRLVQDETEMDALAELGRPGAPRHGRLWGGDPATEER